MRCIIQIGCWIPEERIQLSLVDVKNAVKVPDSLLLNIGDDIDEMKRPR